MPVPTANDGELALADLLDRALNKGVVLWGEAIISLAGVDLVYINLKVLIASYSTMEKFRTQRISAAAVVDGGDR